jgi:hypothetical protein
MKIKLPTSWEAVTLGEWQAIRKLLKSDADPYLVECAIISTLSGADMNDIQSLTREGHGKCMQALAFLKHPIGGKLRNRVRIGRTMYHIETDANKITGGQYIDLMALTKDADKVDDNMHRIMACYATPLKWGLIKQKYNGAIHAQVAEQMKRLPVTVVTPVTDFFLQDYLRFAKNISDYLMREGLKMKAKAEKELSRSSKSSGGFTPYTTSRTAGVNFGSSTLT